MGKLFQRLSVACALSLSVIAFAQEPQAEIKLRNTHYYVALERDYTLEPKDVEILDVKGNLIANVSDHFKRAVDIEGTGRLLDGRIINYAARIGSEIRYTITNAPFGLGVRNCRLVPFRTVAIDPTVVPLGSLIMIRETIGMVLPNGEYHDGLWRAEDVGGAIKKDRIDLFVGDGNQGAVLRRAGITSLMPLTIEIVELPDDDSCVHPRRR